MGYFHMDCEVGTAPVTGTDGGDVGYDSGEGLVRQGVERNLNVLAFNQMNDVRLA